jgi:hypothetical protein
VDVPVTLLADGAENPVRLRDICRDAALIEAPRALPLDTEVGLQMDLPGVNDEIAVKGRVIRVLPGEGGQHGMAILFTTISATSAMRIDFFVALQTDLKSAGGGPIPT